MKEAPLHNDAIRLNVWLAPNLKGDAEIVHRARIAALDLLEHVALALQGFDREEEIHQADRALARLRVHLRVLYELDTLPEAQLLHVHGLMDGIGKQLGGWQRRLAVNTTEERRR